ncbi:MAG: c-type cytochrome, partial [Rhodanobacteraceae bacterium]
MNGVARVLGAVALLAILAAGTARASALRTEGQALFEVHCSSCHGLQLQGSADGPPLFGASAGYVD